MLENKLLVGTE